MGKLTKYFLNGLAFLVPVVVTVYVIYAVFVKVDGLFKFPVRGMGFMVTLVLITVIGFMASNFLTRWAVRWVDDFMRRIPLIRMIYNSLKDLSYAFVGEKKGFRRPVAVSLGGGVKALGFVTSDGLGKLGMEGMVAVYLPQSYNFAGNLVVVPAEQVAPLAADSGDVMAFIVSGGIAAKS